MSSNDSQRRIIHRRLIRILAISAGLAGSWMASPGPLPAQLLPPQDSSDRLELDIPDGPVRAGNGRLALVTDSNGSQVVARVHVEAGDHCIVMLPDGQLRSLPRDQVTPTERPFEPASKAEMIRALKQEFPDFRTRSTRRYLFVYNTSEQYYAGTSRILESMYQPLVKYFERINRAVEEPDWPLVVLMFRTEEDFQAYRPVPESVAAYYDEVSNRVVLYEQSRLGEVAPELALKQAVGNVAHEGVHQILHNINMQQRLSRWPLWLTEGIAEYFAPTDTGKRLKWKGVGQVHDLRMVELEEYFKRTGPGNGQALQKTVEAPRLTSSGYAHAWALTHFLATRRRADFQAYLAEVSSLAPLSNRHDPLTADPPELLAQFQRHFGENLASLETELLKHLQQLPYVDPIEHQTHYVVLVQTLRGAFVEKSYAVTTSPSGARDFREQAAAGLAPGQVTSQVQAFATKTAAERYAALWLRN